MKDYPDKMTPEQARAFKDDVLNAALGLDGEEDFVVYGATVGKMV